MCLFLFLLCKREIDVIVMHFILLLLLCVCWVNEIRPHAQRYEPYDDRHFYIDYLFGWGTQTSSEIGNPMRIINSMNGSYFQNNFIFPDSADDWFIHLDNVMRNKHVNALFFIKKHLNIFVIVIYHQRYTNAQFYSRIIMEKPCTIIIRHKYPFNFICLRNGIFYYYYPIYMRKIYYSRSICIMISTAEYP